MFSIFPLNQVIGATLQLGGQNVLSPSKTRIRPTPTRARPTKTNYGGVPTPTRKNFGPVVGSALPVERVEVQPLKPATQRGVGKVGVLRVKKREFHLTSFSFFREDRQPAQAHQGLAQHEGQGCLQLGSTPASWATMPPAKRNISR